uniref:Uncharacterized protein n=1 Tax=Lepeophtheirus salmonis TaxID=72036 RepID=A0A0K2VGY9_LEPSM
MELLEKSKNFKISCNPSTNWAPKICLSKHKNIQNHCFPLVLHCLKKKYEMDLKKQQTVDPERS